MSQSAPRTLVERYFHEVHRPMRIEVMDELFAVDITLHSPKGDAHGLETLKGILERDVWPLWVPGSVEVEIAFLPLDAADRERHPEDPSALVKFRARLRATRKQPHEQFGLTFTHEVTNVWRIHDGKCVETWPSFSEQTADGDLRQKISDVVQKG